MFGTKHHANEEAPLYYSHKDKALSMEIWMVEGLDLVTSRTGKPLYQDSITKAYSKIDYARVCVLTDIQ